MTQSNPIHDNYMYLDPRPIQSTLPTIGENTNLQKDVFIFIMICEWQHRHKIVIK